MPSPLLSRRELIGATGAAGLLAIPGFAHAANGAATPCSWETVQGRAAALATQPYRAPRKVEAAAAIDYDAVGSIRYRADRELAGGIRLFPLGRYAPMPVAINVVEAGRARAVPFTRDLFEAMSGHAPPLGIAGFRAMAAGGTSDWMAFQGASYFRTSGSQDQYGLSARGLAINTGLPGREEFPDFTEFWIERTGPQGYTVYALMDGASVTGAYRFVSRHDGDGTVQDVSAVLHVRRDIERIGIAPATSMFWYGEGNRAAGSDWRPEIHDSDGLAMLTGRGERVWRPIVNPPRETLDSFGDAGPKGFGLIQRDRAFDHYQDDGAFYDRRPNLWVEPKGDWGAGRVMLYAFPTASETVDNIVSFWTPEAAPKAGQTMRYDYRLTWGSRDLSVAQAAHVVDSWTGAAGRPGAEPVKGARKLVVDFAGAGLAGLDRASGVTPAIEVARGRVLNSAAYPVVGQANRWRVTADIAPESTGPAPGPADVRLFLKRGERALSETMLFPIFPPISPA